MTSRHPVASAKDICDEFDGIFCKTIKGKYEINLPLTELDVPADSPNFQFIKDYRLWNWRRRTTLETRCY